MPTGPKINAPEAGIDKPQGRQLTPELPIVADGRTAVPGVKAHAGLQGGGAGAQRGRAGLPTRDLIGQHQFQEVGVGQVLLLGQGEAFGQRVEHLAELERPQGGFEVAADRVMNGTACRPARPLAGRAGHDDRPSASSGPISIR